jgi:hypothetical protein
VDILHSQQKRAIISTVVSIKPFWHKNFLTRTNTLAYFSLPSLTKNNSIITLTIGVNIKFTTEKAKLFVPGKPFWHEKAYHTIPLGYFSLLSLTKKVLQQ